jgi:hypothetical protein
MYENIRFINGGKFTSRGKWNHTCRTIDSTELIILLSGEVNMFVEDERLSLHEGEVLRILPGELHGGFKESENLSFFWLHFVGAELSELPPRLSKPKNQERTKTLAKELLHYDEEKEYPRECCDSLIKVLLAEMSFGRTEGDGKVVSEIKEYIRRNKESQIKVSEIAEKYNYKTIPTEDVKSGMVLSYGTILMFQPSKVKGLPTYTTEDIRSRISGDEAERIVRWKNSKYGRPMITIVRKIPFAIFITMGTIFYLLMRILLWKLNF